MMMGIGDFIEFFLQLVMSVVWFLLLIHLFPLMFTPPPSVLSLIVNLYPARPPLLYLFGLLLMK